MELVINKKSPVRHYGQFVLYCVSWCSPIHNRYARNHGLYFSPLFSKTQNKTTPEPWFRPGFSVV